MAVDPRSQEPASPFAGRRAGAEDDARTDIASIERAAVQRLRAGQASIDRSLVAVASAQHATVRQSAAGVVVAQSLAADQVHAAVVIAPVVRGEIHALIDLRSAVAIGFGMALGRAVLSLLGRIVRR